MKKQILITGGAGYIGSHAVAELLDSNYEVIVIDSLENGKIEFVDNRATFYKGNIADRDLLKKIFKENNIHVVMHFAGYIKVDESIKVPEKYYTNNSFATLVLLEEMKEADIKNIIFSSTAAVYGEIENNDKVNEFTKTNPINPYGKSKLLAENIIIDFAKAYDFNYIIFRYFNVIGAHKKYRLGQDIYKTCSLVSNIFKVLKGNNEFFELYGNDYSTKDGTCIRDYIHVVDLVKAHILSINLLEKNESEIFNLGNEKGFSVLEILQAIEKIKNIKIPYKVSERRKGDPSSVIACSKKANEMLLWKPEYTNIEDMIKTMVIYNEL
jgi:UDP-glucose 4-epimerase